MDRCDNFTCEAPATARVRYDSVVEGPDASVLACSRCLPDMTSTLDRAPDITFWRVEHLPALAGV